MWVAPPRSLRRGGSFQVRVQLRVRLHVCRRPRVPDRGRGCLFRGRWKTGPGGCTPSASRWRAHRPGPRTRGSWCIRGSAGLASSNHSASQRRICMMSRRCWSRFDVEKLTTTRGLARSFMQLLGGHHGVHCDGGSCPRGPLARGHLRGSWTGHASPPARDRPGWHDPDATGRATAASGRSRWFVSR